MNHFESIEWGFIFSAIGIILGWLLNQLGGWWRVHNDDKRVLKQVLFNLLEVYHLLSRFDINEFSAKIIERVFQQLSPEENTEGNKQMFKKLTWQEVTSFLEPITSEELRLLEKKYQSSISELSKIDPIHAYYLSDKNKIIDKIKLIENWVDYLYQKYPSNELEKEITKKGMTEVLSPNVIVESINDLQREMKAIALKISPVMWIKIKHLLNKNNYQSTESDDKMDEIVIKIMEQMQQNIPQ